MGRVYEHIYGDRYQFKPNELGHTEAMIKKNLDELEFSLGRLELSVVLNCGTGIEAIAFNHLGAKSIHHIDISPVPVRNLRDVSRRDPRYRNIISHQTDLCGDGLAIDEKIDLVYFEGVIHHLYQPDRATANLLALLNKGARVFFRNYRSGTLRFFVADYVRRFIDPETQQIFEGTFRDYFGDFPRNSDQRLTNFYVHLYDTIFDDSFVPVLNLYDDSALERFFESNGVPPLCARRKVKQYDHSVDGRGLTQLSFYFENKNQDFSGLRGRFPGHIDQLTGINYQEPHINSTIASMRNALPVLCGLKPEVRIRVAIELYWAAEGYRLADYDDTFDKGRVMDVSSPVGAHHKMQSLLEPYLR